MKTRGKSNKTKIIISKPESESDVDTVSDTENDDSSYDDEKLVESNSPEPKYIVERTIILKPIMKFEYTDYKPAQSRKHAPTYKDLDGGKKNQYCSLCKQYFNRAPGHPRNMHNHILNDHSVDNSDGTYTCKICSKVSMTRTAVKKHFDQSHRMFDKPKICHICGEELLFYGTAAKHYATHRAKDNAEQNNQFPECKQCDIKFTTKTAFYLHRKSFQ